MSLSLLIYPNFIGCIFWNKFIANLLYSRCYSFIVYWSKMKSFEAWRFSFLPAAYNNIHAALWHRKSDCASQNKKKLSRKSWCYGKCRVDFLITNCTGCKVGKRFFLYVFFAMKIGVIAFSSHFHLQSNEYPWAISVYQQSAIIILPFLFRFVSGKRFDSVLYEWLSFILRCLFLAVCNEELNFSVVASPPSTVRNTIHWKR